MQTKESDRHREAETKTQKSPADDDDHDNNEGDDKNDNNNDDDYIQMTKLGVGDQLIDDDENVRASSGQLTWV